MAWHYEILDKNGQVLETSPPAYRHAFGGTEPVWARNGELFYRIGEKVMVVETTIRPNFSASNPKLLFQGRYSTLQSLPDYDVTPDRQRFLFVKAGEQAPSEISVVVNWTEELNQKVPAGKK